MAATLKQLEVFVAIARTGSFSAAASMVHLSQPAITSMIKKLEDQLQVTLFERTSRGASVTTAGRELLPNVERLVAELTETLASVLSGTAPRGGTVTIACVPSVAALYLPPFIAEFKQLHPTINMVVRDAMPENRGIVGLLRAGDIDLGIASPVDEGSELEFRKLYEDELVALLPVTHPACAQDAVSWLQLSDMPLVGMAYQSVVRLMIDRTFARLGMSKRPVAEVSLITTAVGMARAGIGVAVMPNTAALSCDLAGLKLLRIHGPVVNRPIGFLTGSAAKLTPAAKLFMKFVCSTSSPDRLQRMWRRDQLALTL